MTRTTSDRQQALAQLRAADPIDAGQLRTELDRATLDAEWAQIAARLEAQGSTALTPPGSRLRLVPVALAAGTLAVAGLGLAALLPGADRAGHPVAVLEAAANTAAAQPAALPGPGQQAYTRYRYRELHTHTDAAAPGLAFSLSYEGRGETWTSSHDGEPSISYRLKDHFATPQPRQPVPAGPRDRELLERFGPPSPQEQLGESSGFNRGIFVDNVYVSFPRLEYGALRLSILDLEELPTDPSALASELRGRLRTADDLHMLAAAEAILAQDLASPELRAALYRVVGALDGAEVIERVEDPLGRAGTAVGVEAQHRGVAVRYELIFDPDTAETLAARRVLLERPSWADLEPGATTDYVAYIERAIVGVHGDRRSPIRPAPAK